MYIYIYYIIICSLNYHWFKKGSQLSVTPNCWVQMYVVTDNKPYIIYKLGCEKVLGTHALVLLSVLVFVINFSVCNSINFKVKRDFPSMNCVCIKNKRLWVSN